MFVHVTFGKSPNYSRLSFNCWNGYEPVFSEQGKLLTEREAYQVARILIKRGYICFVSDKPVVPVRR